jgi:hypothetical protein
MHLLVAKGREEKNSKKEIEGYGRIGNKKNGNLQVSVGFWVQIRGLQRDVVYLC